MPSVIDTCNEALAEIGAGSITSLDEGSVEARECARFYPTALADLIETHDWGFAKRRTNLARIVNDRQQEWMYAFARPSGIGSLIAILPSEERLIEQFGPLRYAEEAGVIYTNVARPILEYTSQTIDPGAMPALFRRALVYELAARLAMPVVKDRQVKGDMIQLAAAARGRAMADDMNRNPRRTVEYVSDATKARLGIPLDNDGLAVDFEPIGDLTITIVDG